MHKNPKVRGPLKNILKGNKRIILTEPLDYDELISDNETSMRCRNLAESFYSLSSGSKKYSMIYKSLIDPN